jgi:hypothetical protein
MSVDRAYAELLKDKKGVPVIVGIVDSGVDIERRFERRSLDKYEKKLRRNR